MGLSTKTPEERLKDLEDHGNSPISIVKFLLNASLNRKLEMSEIHKKNSEHGYYWLCT